MPRRDAAGTCRFGSSRAGAGAGQPCVAPGWRGAVPGAVPLRRPVHACKWVAEAVFTYAVVLTCRHGRVVCYLIANHARVCWHFV